MLFDSYLEIVGMKTQFDPRHQKRIKQMQQLFSRSFPNAEANIQTEDIESHFPDLDSMIQKAAPEWPVDKIAKIDLAILRLATFEMTVEKKEPQKVIIDEAIELAKAYGNPNSAKFINGVLGTILKSL